MNAPNRILFEETCLTSVLKQYLGIQFHSRSATSSSLNMNELNAIITIIVSDDNSPPFSVDYSKTHRVLICI